MKTETFQIIPIQDDFAVVVDKEIKMRQGATYSIVDDNLQDGYDKIATIIATVGSKRLDRIPNIDWYEKRTWDIAKELFEDEEGRLPNCNNDKDLLAVSAIDIGYRAAQEQITKEDKSWLLSKLERNDGWGNMTIDEIKRAKQLLQTETKQFPISVEFEMEYEPTTSLSSRGCVLSDEECGCDASESSWCEHRFAVKYSEKLKIHNPTTNTIKPFKINWR